MLPELPGSAGLSAAGGPLSPGGAGKTFELSQHYCSFCRLTVLHSVLEKMQPPELPAAGPVVLLLQCKACGAFSLQ